MGIVGTWERLREGGLCMIERLWTCGLVGGVVATAT